jgi:hypothetical protein
MARIESLNGNLPVALDLSARRDFARSIYARQAPKAAFLSQLIAEKHHMPSQRERRQATVPVALQTYDAGGRIAERRLPPGYRMDLET